MAELQAKLARQKPATSFVAQAQHREDRQRRKAQAGAAPALAAMVVQGSDPTAVPRVEYAAGAEGRDEREESAWFRQLPPAEQDRLRKVWGDKRELSCGAASAERRRGNRRFVAAIVVFAATIVLGTHIYWHATLGAGIACGLWWRRTAPDRFLDPLRAIASLFPMQGTAMVVHQQVNPTLFMDSVLLVALAAIVGFDGEIRRTGGFDQT